MRAALAAMLGGAAALCAAPALASKNIAACDIVIFASAAEPPVVIPAERWETYRTRVEGILEREGVSDGDVQAAADDLVEVQTELLAPVHDSDAYQDYLASDQCFVLRNLGPKSVAAVLAELEASAPETVAAARRIADGARRQVDMITRSARFRSTRDRTLLAAQYYCFAAGGIHAALSPEQQKRVTVERFGATTTCRDAGRKN